MYVYLYLCKAQYELKALGPLGACKLPFWGRVVDETVGLLLNRPLFHL
jgi:hypothetical protein